MPLTSVLPPAVLHFWTDEHIKAEGDDLHYTKLHYNTNMSAHTWPVADLLRGFKDP